MTLQAILLFSGLALVLRLAWYRRTRLWVLMVTSVLAVYWMQPSMPVRNLDFWLPTATLALVLLGWILVTPPEARRERRNLWAGLVLLALVCGVALTRYLSQTGILTPSRPPQFAAVAPVLLGLAVLAVLLGRYTRPGRILLSLGTLGLIVLLVVLKQPSLAQGAAATLRDLVGQNPALATPLDVRWLGFSYLAFRLIHTFRDRQSGRLPVVSLPEYLVYAVFFPAFTAGPIDRLERFVKDLRAEPPAAAGDFIEGGRRLVLGLFKKFVLADSLALIALNSANAQQTQSTGWMWLWVYAYALQIYLDFSGYTDIAIGMARLLGIKLPENFNRPYLRPNLTQFWNNWHMTLTQWFRAYFFNPVTRALRRGEHPWPPVAVIFVTQMATMLLIGLWHGITFNFILWGLWHGLGMFVQNRWSDWVRPRLPGWATRPFWQRALPVLGALLTFHFVALGWVWFALPDPALSWHVLVTLLGGR
ncbi:MAG: MBOAT family O-acyltransferase [Anaerolineaceae bacterium]|nr:MBOAT family O-acyltransferase [Anaerolineaceae bacterium]